MSATQKSDSMSAFSANMSTVLPPLLQTRSVLDDWNVAF